jgi:hypothetical protein
VGFEFIVRPDRVIHTFSTAIHTQFRSKTFHFLFQNLKTFAGKDYSQKNVVGKRKIKKIGKYV